MRATWAISHIKNKARDKARLSVIMRVSFVVRFYRVKFEKPLRRYGRAGQATPEAPSILPGKTRSIGGVGDEDGFQVFGGGGEAVLAALQQRDVAHDGGVDEIDGGDMDG